MELIVTTKADLKALLDEQAERLKAELLEMLESFKTENFQNNEIELMTIEQICQYFKIDRSTLHRWTKKGRLKQHAIEGKVYYKRHEVEQAMMPIN